MIVTHELYDRRRGLNDVGLILRCFGEGIREFDHKDDYRTYFPVCNIAEGHERQKSMIPFTPLNRIPNNLSIESGDRGFETRDP